MKARLTNSNTKVAALGTEKIKVTDRNVFGNCSFLQRGCSSLIINLLARLHWKKTWILTMELETTSGIMVALERQYLLQALSTALICEYDDDGCRSRMGTNLTTAPMHHPLNPNEKKDV
jgi:hypothetical protein